MTGGYMPEYGRTSGGAISAITKSGGNEFHGSVWGTYTPGSLTGPADTVQGATPDHPGAARPGELRRLRRHHRRLHHQGQALVLRRHPVRGPALHLQPLVQPADQRAPSSRSPTRSSGASPTRRPSTTSASSPTSSQPRPPAEPDRHRHAHQGRWPRRGDHPQPLHQPRPRSTPPCSPSARTTPRPPRSSFNALDITAELNSSFIEKRLLLDIRARGAHAAGLVPPRRRQRPRRHRQPGRPGRVPQVRSPAGVPTPVYQLDTSVPASVTQACTEPGATCNVVRYFTGGPGGLLETAELQQLPGASGADLPGHLARPPRAQGRLRRADRHLRPRRDLQRRGGPTAAAWTSAGPGHGLRLPALHLSHRAGHHQRHAAGPDRDQVDHHRRLRPGQLEHRGQGHAEHRPPLRRLALQGQDGQTRISLGDQWSPRIGVVWDPTQQGRSKIFANYGRYYENIPLDISDRALSSSQPVGVRRPRLQSRSKCIGRAATPTRLNGGSALINGFTEVPNRKWNVTGPPYPSYVDPNLKSPSNDEIVAGRRVRGHPQRPRSA